MNPNTANKAVNRAYPALKPALASIQDACKYMGDVSRGKFYADVLPLLETVYIGTRRCVVVASMDRLIARLLNAKNASPKPVEGTPKPAKSGKAA